MKIIYSSYWRDAYMRYRVCAKNQGARESSICFCGDIVVYDGIVRVCC